MNDFEASTFIAREQRRFERGLSPRSPPTAGRGCVCVSLCGYSDDRSAIDHVDVYSTRVLQADTLWILPHSFQRKIYRSYLDRTFLFHYQEFKIC